MAHFHGIYSLIKKNIRPLDFNGSYKLLVKLGGFTTCSIFPKHHSSSRVRKKVLNKYGLFDGYFFRSTLHHDIPFGHT
jgi:hypothetical protein